MVDKKEIKINISVDNGSRSLKRPKNKNKNKISVEETDLFFVLNSRLRRKIKLDFLGILIIGFIGVMTWNYGELGLVSKISFPILYIWGILCKIKDLITQYIDEAKGLGETNLSLPEICDYHIVHKILWLFGDKNGIEFKKEFTEPRLIQI